MGVRLQFDFAIVPQRSTVARSALVAEVLILCCLGLSGCSQKRGLSPDEDAVISYLQSATSLANLLQLKFDERSKKQHLTALVVPGGKEPVDYIERIYADVLKFKEAVSRLPTQKRQQLCQTNKDLLRTEKDACEKLKQRHSKKSSVLAKDWDRYWQAISYGLEMSEMAASQ